MLLIMLASYQAVLKELEGAPWPPPPPPQHNQDVNMNSNTNLDSHQMSRSNTPPGGGGGGGASTPMRFTALHVTMIFIAILLCVVICAIPWDNFKCGNNSTTNTNSSTNQEHHNPGTNPSSTDEEDGRQVGLSKKMIKSFQLVRYGVSSLREKAEEQQEEGGGGSCWTECMICLSDFRNGQMVRILPHCNHGFHKKCIDQWLLSHTSCPICRNVLLVLNSPEKTFPPRHHLEQARHSDQLASRHHEQHEDRADPTPDVASHDEDPPPPVPPVPTASSVNHQDYQSVYRTYIVISD